ncbi:MAG: hypothetical protein L0211_22510 [Planctomycetaceae bacterium]|nr:hypothetical protein [Planctomycetaceae bacterium]
MPIETICQSCGKRLRVGDENAGRLAKCPECQAVFTVPQPGAWSAENAAESQLSSADRWHLKTPDGLSFGPVSRAELDRWLVEGRVTPLSQILHETSGQWVPAAQIFPHLAIVTGAPFSQSPFTPGTLAKPVDLPAGNPFGEVNPYASPSTAGYVLPAGRRYREPHRGGLILALSIIGPLFCIFASIASFVMAMTDLNEMKRGVRDPSGRGLTIAGLVISSIYFGLLAIYVAFLIGMVIVEG